MADTASVTVGHCVPCSQVPDVTEKATQGHSRSEAVNLSTYADA